MVHLSILLLQKARFTLSKSEKTGGSMMMLWENCSSAHEMLVSASRNFCGLKQDA